MDVRQNVQQNVQQNENTAGAGKDADGWDWWAGSNEEHYEFGPFSSRAEAIEEAKSDGMCEQEIEPGEWAHVIHVTEARKDPLKLSDWIKAEDLLDRADEAVGDSDRVNYDFDEPPYFDCNPAQFEDLAARITKACDEWQAEHELTFKTHTFSDTRNTECVTIPFAADDDMDVIE